MVPFGYLPTDNHPDRLGSPAYPWQPPATSTSTDTVVLDPPHAQGTRRVVYASAAGSTNTSGSLQFATQEGRMSAPGGQSRHPGTHAPFK